MNFQDLWGLSASDAQAAGIGAGVLAVIAPEVVIIVVAVGVIVSPDFREDVKEAAIDIWNGLGKAGEAMMAASDALKDGVGSVVNSLITLAKGEKKSEREMKPNDAPTGTKPIDKAGLDRETVHRVKDGIGNGAKDWTGISPDGDVIINRGDGSAENLGPYTDYLP